VFTKALNNLTAMQADIEAEIDNLNTQKEELELNISYFQDFANQITDAPEDSGAFLQELKNQVALLVDNGKNLNNALAAAKKLAKSVQRKPLSQQLSYLERHLRKHILLTKITHNI
jgi:ABC-type transporter Mla subunit MlaD